MSGGEMNSVSDTLSLRQAFGPSDEALYLATAQIGLESGAETRVGAAFCESTAAKQMAAGGHQEKQRQENECRAKARLRKNTWNRKE